VRIIEVLSEAGAEREEIEIIVPATYDRNVQIVIRSVSKKPANAGDVVATIETITDEKAAFIPRPVWDNLIAALATQKAVKR
jgi:hypothetical protein